MADKSPAKAKKRQVKNPETFRERAVKAAEAGDKPTKATQLKAGSAKAAGPVKRSARKVAEAKSLKPLHKPARIFGKILVPTYFRKSWVELKLVTWPTWKESRRLTTAVLIFAIVFGAVVGLVDLGLDKIFKNILVK